MLQAHKAHKFLFHHIAQLNVKPSNRFEFSHIFSLPATTASHFLRNLLVDQLYTKEVYFCSFVTKSNQASTRYSPDVFNSFHRTATHGEPSHRIFITIPLMQCFPCFTKEPLPFVASPFLFIFSLQPSKSPPKDIQDFNRSCQASSHVIFLVQTKFHFWRWPYFPPLAGTPPKVHAVSIDPDISLLRELGLQQIYL